MQHTKALLQSAAQQARAVQAITWHPTIEEHIIDIEARGIRSTNIRNGEEKVIARFNVQTDDAVISPQGNWILLITERKSVLQSIILASKAL